MASRLKHKQRSHKTYSKTVNAGIFGDFEKKARMKKVKAESKSFLQSIKEAFHRSQSK